MSGDERVRDLLGRLRDDTAQLPGDELRSAARSATRKPRTHVRSGARRAKVGRRAAIAAVAGALLIGSGLGFGLGSSVTPTGSAGANVVGFGFLPAKGWTVVQAELAAPGTARAVAANVALHPDDPIGAVPRATIESLPPHGVLIVATFRPRGDPERELLLATGEPPLSAASAEHVDETFHPQVRRHRLEAGIGTYDVVLDIHLGSAQTLGAAQGQLNGLVVASERVTIFSRPGTLFGSVDSRRSGESVTIQARDCGHRAFRVVAGATTEDGGGWSMRFFPGINTTVRAVWRDATSSAVTIREPAQVTLQKRPGVARRLSVLVIGKRNFWRKRVRIQRFDRRLGVWRNIRWVVLTDTHAPPGASFTSTAAEFTLGLPRGTLVRAAFPLSEARPCYGAGVSRAVRL